MSRIFISHSSLENAQAIALRDFLVAEGWSDLFLDLDPHRGIAAGERWERALNEAARRCEAVVFLISKAWLASRWCMNELSLARRLNKRLFGVVIEEGLSIAGLPSDVTSTWQLVQLATGYDHQQFRVTLPISGEQAHVTFSREGLSRLKTGLQRAGLGASHFAWPPADDTKRAPYRGLRPLEAEDAGIFFGREASVIEAIDRLRGLKDSAPPRLFVILGASGAGKSSFMRAGILPRLRRDDATFLPLPVIRPEVAALSGQTGFLDALTKGFEAAELKVTRGELREAISSGPHALKTKLRELASHRTQVAEMKRLPAVVIAVDQGEELFLAEAETEAQTFLTLLRELLTSDDPAVIAVFTIRSDSYERMQSALELEGLHQETMGLPPMPKGSFGEVIRGPLKRLEGTDRTLKIDDRLVEAIFAEIEEGVAKDALPLLAFTLERLYEEYHQAGYLKLEHYEKLGGIKGSIEAAVARVFKAADKDERIPREKIARLLLLRRGLIPWLAGIDPETGAPRRRVARLSEIPTEARPLIDLLVEQRLLSTDVSKETGETTIEPAHESLLRQWSLLNSWLNEHASALELLDGLKRASHNWIANRRGGGGIAHLGGRLIQAEEFSGSDEYLHVITQDIRDYLAACRRTENALIRNRNLGTKFKSKPEANIRAFLFALLVGFVCLILLYDYDKLAPLAVYAKEKTLAAMFAGAAVLLIMSQGLSKLASERIPVLSRSLRYALSRRDFIEGDWSNVVIDLDTKQLMYLSFLSISYRDGQLVVTGDDWHPDGTHSHAFQSLQAMQTGNKLLYWYEQCAGPLVGERRGYAEAFFFPPDKLPRRHVGWFVDPLHSGNVRYYATRISDRFLDRRLTSDTDRIAVARELWIKIEPHLSTMNRDVDGDFSIEE